MSDFLMRSCSEPSIRSLIASRCVAVSLGGLCTATAAHGAASAFANEADEAAEEFYLLSDVGGE